MTTKSPEILARARALYQAGKTFVAIGADIGVNPDTAHQWVDPVYAAKRARRDRERPARKRLLGEAVYRNQYISAELPTLAYVPIELKKNSRYQMRAP